MKNSIKIIISLLLIIIFLVVCSISAIGAMFGAWLHTYKTFTQKELVAVIEIEKAQKDEDGYEFTNVKYKQLKRKSALTSIFSSRADEEDVYELESDYQIYGDQIEVGGQYVKFNDFWTLFNVKNIFKITRIEGDHSDADIERELPSEKRSVYDLNGGTDEYWKKLQKDQDRYSFLVDSVYGSYSSKFVQDESVTFGLYATEDGFLLDKLD